MSGPFKAYFELDGSFKFLLALYVLANYIDSVTSMYATKE